MINLLLIFLLSYPDSARIIGHTRHSGGIGGQVGNRVSVRDSRGWIHCVYSSGIGTPNGSGPSDIFYVFSTDNGLTWSDSMNVSRNTPYNSDEPSLAIDSRDVLHCIWRQYFEEGGGAIRYHDVVYSYYANGIWSEPVKIGRRSSGTKSSYYSSLIIDSRNRLHIVFDAGTGPGNWDIFYSYLDGDSWTLPYNISQDPYDSAFPSLVIDNQGNLHLVYRTRITRTPIMYSKYNGSYWSTPVVISDTFPGGLATIVVDSRCNPHVIFKGHYTKLINNQWTHPQRIVNMGDTLCAAYHFAIDSCNNLYMVWQARLPSGTTYQEDIYYCTFHGISWSNPINLTNDTTRSFTPKLGNSVHSLGVDLVWLNMPNDTVSQFDVMYMRLNPVGTGIEEIATANKLLMTFGVKVYPNPARSKTAIHYSLPTESKISLSFYDISGRLVKTLVDEYKKPGNYKITLNSKTLSAGVYFLSLQTTEKRIIERLVIVK